MTCGLKPSETKAYCYAKNPIMANSSDHADQDVKNGGALANMSIRAQTPDFAG